MHHNTIGSRAAAGSTIGLAAVLLTVGGLVGCSSGSRPLSANSTVPSTVAATAGSGAIGSGSSVSETSAVAAETSAVATTEVATSTTVEQTTTELPTTTSTTTTTTEPPTTTTTIVVQGAIVKVANATKVPGGASKLTKLMTNYGFQMAEPTDAAGNEEFRDTTQIYCLPGSEAVAGSIGILLDGVPVNYMPTPAPITDATVGLGDASVLVMLGKDLAGKNPPGLKTG